MSLATVISIPSWTLTFWVADLACGHTRHVRHDPPWQNRAWVVTEQGRREMIGFELEDKFEYPSNPVIGAPGAFTTEQLQVVGNVTGAATKLTSHVRYEEGNI